ncbi:MAG: hypothetical protein K2Q01_03595, partial [Rickettsiales bacterium]|nr:hypothetical protein [Rickettsiales bacterium]
GILAVVGGLMLFSLLTRPVLELNVIHDRNPLFVKLSDGTLRNGYTIHILNKTQSDRTYSLSVEGLENAQLRIQSGTDTETASLPVFADSVGHFRVFVTAPKQPQSRQTITLSVEDTETHATTHTSTIFVTEGK